VDTSGWIAQANRRDDAHASVAETLRAFDGRLVTTNLILAETIAWCTRLGHATAVSVGEVLRDPDVVDLVRVETRDEDAAWRHFVARPERRLSFTDCTSFVIARRLGVTEVLTLDEDFRAEGFTVLPGRP
jgi:predicted nucleic acid-binding protein